MQPGQRQFNFYWQGAKRLLGLNAKRRHDNTLKVLAVKWAIDNDLLPEGTKWYAENWQKVKVFESNGKELYWNWKYRIRINCTETSPVVF